MRASVIFFFLIITLTIFNSNPASAQSISAQSTVYEERQRVSGWENNLVNRDRNLGHYYWTDMERTKRYRCNVINNVAPKSANPNKIIHLNLKPRVIQPTRTKDILGALRSAPQSSAELNGKLLAKSNRGNSAQSASAYTYASYGHKNEGGNYDYESSRAVKGRLMAY